MKSLIVGIVLGAMIAGPALAESTARHAAPLTDHENTNNALKKLDAAIPISGGHPVGMQSAIFCGQLANNGTIYLGPVAGDGTGAGEGIAADAGGTACNALDNATEATADAPIFLTLPIRVVGMYCRAVADGGTTGSGSNGVSFALRVAAAAASPVMSCTVATTAIECSSFPVATDATAQKIAANTAMAIEAISTEDLSAMDGWCRVFYTF